ncbi:hypothetical protein [Pedobacter hartonius]|uniref:Uncharacterized protein n=1 Tax=Pedobacter hartonius TaxID=425514 RepID=A0A1H4DV55_9SPHI|nr:hypothetical protein [Pedobacter hartonius]SEA76644.1 hypothetical protein SAMN05443550_105120 [Pedobacter hartonius]
MTQRTLNKIEGIGLIIILLTSFIQQSENTILSSKQEFDYYKIHNKLDNLWTITSHQYAENHPGDSVRFLINFKAYRDHWKIYSEEERHPDAVYLNKEIANYESLRILAFFIGSIMLIAPKFVRNTDDTECSTQSSSFDKRRIIYRSFPPSLKRGAAIMKKDK